MSLKEKLSKIQREIKVPKELFNKFGGFYYRNAETILSEFKKYEEDLKVSLILEDEVVEVAGNIYVKATAILMDCESEERIYTTAYARESEQKKGMDEAQITGSASSYARKYALNGLFLLDDVKDPDTDEYRNQQTESSATQNNKNTKSQKVNQNHIISLRKIFEEKGIDENKVLVMYKVEKIEDLTINQFKNIFDHESELIQQCGV